MKNFKTSLIVSICQARPWGFFVDVCGVRQIECAEKKTGKPVIGYQLKVIGKSEIETKEDTALGALVSFESN
jgi:hypothetical protein